MAMTDEERIEAAVAAGTAALMWERPDSDDLAAMRMAVQAIVQAFYPELHHSPPRAWLAPWEATYEMVAASYSVHPKISTGERDEIELYAAMRDAHLAQGSGE